MAAEDLDAQWSAALAGLTELAQQRVTVVAMPPPNPQGRVRATIQPKAAEEPKK